MRQATDQALPLVMVTGASSGIGKALAMAFAREGHPLLLISRHIEPIAGLPEDTVYRQADVADYGAITAAVEAAAAVHGPVGCLVNNAGMADARAFEDVDEPSYARELDTNLKGVFNCAKAVLSGMRARQSGTIINIAPGYIRTNIHSGMHISFEEYRARLGNPDFMTAEELAEIVLFCWKQPVAICIRDLVVAPTRTTF